MSGSEEAARLLKGLQKECNMLATTPTLDSLANLASQLSPREQLELLVRISQRLGGGAGTTGELPHWLGGRRSASGLSIASP